MTTTTTPLSQLPHYIHVGLYLPTLTFISLQNILLGIIFKQPSYQIVNATSNKKTHKIPQLYDYIYDNKNIYIIPYIIRAAGYMFCNCSHFSPYNFYQMLDFKLTSATNIDTTTF